MLSLEKGPRNVGTGNHGKASRGSQLWLQRLVNSQPELLNAAIINAAPQLSGQNLGWVSPLAAENFKEYQDQAFLEKLAVELPSRSLRSFWPKHGPVWDGLARSSGGDILLVEAKSHIPEAVSPACAASARSRKLIRSSLREAKRFLEGKPEADWAGPFYQVTNRLAHLYLLRVLNELPAHLVFLYFVGDREMQGPETIEEWRGAVRVIETFLGVGHTKLSPFIHHVYLDVQNLVPPG